MRYPSRNVAGMQVPDNSLQNSDHLVVELVGPAGSGKSTIIAALRDRHGSALGYVGRPRPTIMQRLIAAAEALPAALSLRPLSVSERRRLFAAYRGIRASMWWLRTLPPGVHVIDEGPHRIVHDYACFSERQLAAWRRIVTKSLGQLSALPVLVVHVKASPGLRRERRKERMGPLEHRDPTFNDEVEPKNRRLLFIRDEIERLSPLDSAFRSMRDVENVESVEGAIRGVLDVIQHRSGSSLKVTRASGQ